MIKLKIETDGKDVLDEFNNENCTLLETGVVLLRLEQIKQELINKEFESKFEVHKDA